MISLYILSFSGFFHSRCISSILWLCSAGNMESLCAGSWLSSTRLYMIIRASAGYGWVQSCTLPVSAVIIKQSFLCYAVRWDFQLPLSLSCSCTVWSLYGAKHNVLITCARPLSSGDAEDSAMCVMKSLFIRTVLHVHHSVTENGGSVLWQHHRTAEDWTGVLPNGLLWQEVSFLPQGKAHHLVRPPDTVRIQLRSFSFVLQQETVSSTKQKSRCWKWD